MPKVIEESAIKNNLFAKLEDGTVARLGGLVRRVDMKETAYATALRFKGDLACQVREEVIRARSAFFPESISAPIVNAAKKLGKWESFEFALVARKKDGTWDVEFAIAPRVEKSRALSLLETIK